MGGSIPARDHLGRDYPSMTAMARAWGIAPTTLTARLDKGWSMGQALAIPPNPLMSKSLRATPWGRLMQMAGPKGVARTRHSGKPPEVVVERLARGWTLDEALAAHAHVRMSNLKRGRKA